MSYDLHGQEIRNNFKNKGQVPQYSKVLEYQNNNENTAIITENKSLKHQKNKRNITISNTTLLPLSNANDRHFEKLLELRVLDTNNINKKFCGTHSTLNNRVYIAISIIISILYVRKKFLKKI